MLRKTLLAATAILLSSAAANAMPITGSFSMVGFDFGYTADGIGNLTGLDFDVVGGTPDDTGSGLFIAGSGSGIFSGINTLGSINSFSFGGLPTGLWAVVHSGTVFTFQANSIIDSLLNLGPIDSVFVEIAGTLSGGMYDATPGIWSFTGNVGEATASWSASTVTQVSEPASLALLGLGLIGLGAIRRKMAA